MRGALRQFPIQALGLAMVLAGCWLWLGIPDERTWQVALAGLGALALAAFAAWLAGVALAAFQAAPTLAAFRSALQRLPRLLPWTLLIVALAAAAVYLGSYDQRLTAYTASAATKWLQKPVKPESIHSIYPALRWLAFAVLALLVFPWMPPSRAPGSRPRRQWRYWAWAAAAIALGTYLPYKLVWWVPPTGSFAAEVASVLLRFGLAYLMAVAAWLLLARTVARFSAAGA
ncbi:MAG: hypothetical protein HYS04_06300 [Acidobacteria bacterium]|nr:hypothetical protein [Acidobacteriota bacterium]